MMMQQHLSQLMLQQQPSQQNMNQLPRQLEQQLDCSGLRQLRLHQRKLALQNAQC